AAAAGAAHPGLQGAEGKGCRDGSIDRIAAGAQHIGTDIGCLLVLRGNDAVARAQRVFPVVERAAQILRHRSMPPKQVTHAALPGMLHSEKAICGRNRSHEKDSLDPDRPAMVSFVSLHTNSRGELTMQ